MACSRNSWQKGFQDAQNNQCRCISVLLRLWGDLRKPPLIALPQLLDCQEKLVVLCACTCDPVVLSEHSDMICRISSAAWSFPIRVFRTVSIALHRDANSTHSLRNARPIDTRTRPSKLESELLVLAASCRGNMTSDLSPDTRKKHCRELRASLDQSSDFLPFSRPLRALFSEQPLSPVVRVPEQGTA